MSGYFRLIDREKACYLSKLIRTKVTMEFEWKIDEFYHLSFKTSSCIIPIE